MPGVFCVACSVGGSSLANADQKVVPGLSISLRRPLLMSSRKPFRRFLAIDAIAFSFDPYSIWISPVDNLVKLSLTSPMSLLSAAS